MIIVRVKIRNNSKVFTYQMNRQEVNRGEQVIVETQRGVEIATVVMTPREATPEEMEQSYKMILRVATPEDLQREENNRVKEQEAFRICQEKIEKHGLEMKLVETEYTFDNNKLLFYFTADGRIDFRQLVKDLASVFRTRIELRQIGVRDECRLKGGVGVCGRALCCQTYLQDFAPVSIKMAKDQGLPLNPTKISGVCGRLMCCLKNEQDTYDYLNNRLPNEGDLVGTPEGLKGEVHSVSVLRQLVKVVVTLDKDEKEIREYKAEELKVLKGRRRKDRSAAVADAEVKKLEEIEKKERREKLYGDNN